MSEQTIKVIVNVKPEATIVIYLRPDDFSDRFREIVEALDADASDRACDQIGQTANGNKIDVDGSARAFAVRSTGGFVRVGCYEKTGSGSPWHIIDDENRPICGVGKGAGRSDRVHVIGGVQVEPTCARCLAVVARLERKAANG